MLKYVLIVNSLLFSSCLTPREWSADQHFEMMGMCRSMCKKTGVLSYEPMSGECTCFSKKSK